ncbi:MAG: hypothetical protein KAQ62_09890, partial [Cyclobacteriaceae bacterium]|nr:hypothetical protein [Cyclobacteriaceae bacterium]
MKDKLRIIVTGLIGQHYTMGGVTWDYIQYLIGLQNLGYDVYYFEDTGEWPYNLDGGSTGDKWEAANCSANINHIHSVLKRYGLEKNWAYKYPVSNSWYGMSKKIRNEILQSADLLINVSGTLVFPEHYKSVKRLAYIDSDPGFTELKMHDKEFSDRVSMHDVHFSFGELLHKKKLDSGINWLPTRSPIILSEWESKADTRDVYTTIMNWTSYKPLKWEGKTYGQKDTEFVKYLDLPEKYRAPAFEVAMSNVQHDNWKSKEINEYMNEQFDSPQEMLVHHGWKVVDSQQVCQDMDSYRTYIERSKGEWSVAKGGYVMDKTGWFSCRSACYLAAGKPVIIQGTGFEKILPTV